MKKIPFFAILLSVFTLSLTAGGSGETTSEGQDGNLTAYVSILPQAYFLERLAGGRVNIEVMVPPGKSPSTYEPTPQQVVGLGGADVFFTIGVPFEAAFLPVIEKSVKDLKISDSSRGIEKRHLASHSHEENEHEAEDDHEADDDHDEDGIIDPHVWMSPVLAADIAGNMADELIKLDPEGAEAYKTGLTSLKKDLAELDARLSQTLAPFEGSTLFVFHPGFGYFADRYGLVQEAIETGGKEPSPADLERIITQAQEEGVKVIFVQPEFSQSSAQAVAQAINGSVVTAETLNKNYIDNLSSLAERIEEGIK